MSLQQLSGKQIRPGVLEDLHIKGKLTEAVLDINWADPSHAQEILKNKVITDYVQFATPLTVATGESQVSQVFSLDDSTIAIPGVIIGGALRFRTENGDIITHDGKEVKAIIDSKVGPDAAGFEYIIKFYQADGKTPYTFTEGIKIDFLYPVKTTLWDAVENFASNERFVDGAVDVMSKMKIEQLVADVFGAGYTFTGDGSPSLAETITDKLIRLTQGTINTGTQTPEIIDEVVIARGGKASLDDRLVEIEASTEFINDHLHGKDAKKLAAEKAEFEFATDFTKIGANVLKVTDDFDIYINGQLQEETLNYTLTKDATDAFVNGFSFSEPLVVGDVVSLRWTIYR